MSAARDHHGERGSSEIIQEIIGALVHIVYELAPPDGQKRIGRLMAFRAFTKED